jgi:hypothetical protein
MVEIDEYYRGCFLLWQNIYKPKGDTMNHAIILVAAGVIFLIFMGIVTWRSKTNTTSSAEVELIRFARVISFTVMISLLNPMRYWTPSELSVLVR